VSGTTHFRVLKTAHTSAGGQAGGRAAENLIASFGGIWQPLIFKGEDGWMVRREKNFLCI
jgi:hypothetical protein